MDNSSYQKVEHLNFIQTIIARLANNSFLVRGWLVAILVGSLAVSDRISESVKSLPLFYFSLIMLFWLSDAYFLYKERQFRTLYDLANEDNFQNYTMKTSNGNEGLFELIASLLLLFFSFSLFIFYIPLQLLLFFLAK